MFIKKGVIMVVFPQKVEQDSRLPRNKKYAVIYYSISLTRLCFPVGYE